MSSCFVCENAPSLCLRNQYFVCQKCGHECLKEGQLQQFIVNEEMNLKLIKQKSVLINFQCGVVKKVKSCHSLFIDIGCGPGRLLLHVGDMFSQKIGIEVTKECLAFAKKTLSLDVRPSLSEIKEPKCLIATFWHSLEHMPKMAIDETLKHLNSISLPGSKLIISVPNADSFMYRLFKKRWPFYDVPNHLHQFTHQSLNELMGKYGFVHEKTSLSLPYNLFGYLQGLLNVFNSEHNYFYYRQRRGQEFGCSKTVRYLKDFYNLLLIGAMLPLALFLSAYDAILPKKGGVITVVFAKEKESIE